MEAVLGYLVRGVLGAIAVDSLVKLVREPDQKNYCPNCGHDLTE